jgi:hypothetical protein
VTARLSRDVSQGLAPAGKGKQEQDPENQPRHHANEHPRLFGHSGVAQEDESKHAGEEDAKRQPENTEAQAHGRRKRSLGKQRRQHGGDGE